MSVPLTPDWCREETMAALLDLPCSTFREYVGKGWLPEGVKLGRHRLWNREQVNAALAKMQQGELNGDAVMEAIAGMGHHGKKKSARHVA
jgi:hypothetical protein